LMKSIAGIGMTTPRFPSSLQTSSPSVAVWPLPRHGGKEGGGRALIGGVARQMPGAVVLAGTAALRAGAGKLQIATTAGIAPHVATVMVEAMVAGCAETASGALAPECGEALLERIRQNDALVFGPGMVDEGACGALLAAVVARLDTPAVIDATALGCLHAAPEMLHRLDGRVILTPHGGEMAKMLGIERETVEGEPLTHVREAARRFGAVVALKNTQTFIATPDGELDCNRSGHVGLATSGSGDTLAGIIGGILARGLSPLQAAAWGVYLHAQAGEQLAARMGVGFLAREIPAEIPALMRRLQ